MPWSRRPWAAGCWAGPGTWHRAPPEGGHMTSSTPPSDSEAQPAPLPAARTNEGWQPGDPTPREFVERAIRVDQAGEFGAVRIYEGQLAALRWRGQGDSPAARKIEHMLAQ